MNYYFIQAIKIIGRLALSVIIFLFILTTSCRRIIVYDSSAEIVRRSIDTALNDSALIYGAVYDAGDKNRPYINSEVWIEGSDFKTNSDSLGNFGLKVLPGTYTLKCLYPYSDVSFTAALNNIVLSPNEKIEVLFFHGYIVE